MATGAPARRHPLDARAAIAAVVALLSLAYAWNGGARVAGIDVFQFWAGGRAASVEGSRLYSAETRARLPRELAQQAIQANDPRMLAAAQSRPQLELFSTPFLYACFAALPSRYESAFHLYRALCLAATVAALALLGWMLKLSPVRTLLLMAFVFALYEPLESDVRVGNVNQLQLFAIAVGLAFASARAVAWRQLVAGAILGAAVLFKPNVALVLPLLALASWRNDGPRRALLQLGGGAAGALAAVGIGGAYFRDFGAWTAWLGALRSLAQTTWPRESGNVAPALPLVDEFGGASAYVLAIGLTFAAVWAIWNRRATNDVLVAGLGLTIALLSATLVWTHYLLLALPLLFALQAEALKVVRVVAAVALTLIGGDVWIEFFELRSYAAEAVLVWLGLAAAFVTAVAAPRAAASRVTPAAPARTHRGRSELSSMPRARRNRG